jgi:hypothetical protein
VSFSKILVKIPSTSGCSFGQTSLRITLNPAERGSGGALGETLNGLSVSATHGSRRQVMSMRFLRIAASSSKHAVRFSSARTTNRFASRWASAIQIVRPRNQRLRPSPNSNPFLLRLSAMILHSDRNSSKLWIYIGPSAGRSQAAEL